MRTTLVFATMAVAITLSGCATPNLQGVVPFDAEIQEAQRAISREAVPPPRNLQRADWQNTLNRVKERIQRPAFRVCNSVQGQDCNLAFRSIRLVDDDEINAYVDEQNRINVHTGLIERAANDEEIAAVLAHEYGHIFAGHIGKSGQNTAIGMLIGTAIGLAVASQGYDPNGDLTATLLESGYNAGSLAYSPQFELEADYFAALILDRAEIDLEHGKDILVRLARTGQGSANAGSWGQRARLMASTHPANDFRIARWLGVSRSMDISRTISSSFNEEVLVEDALDRVLAEPLYPRKTARWVNPQNGHSGMVTLSIVQRQPKCDQVCVIYSNVVYTQAGTQSKGGEICKVNNGEWGDPINWGQSWKVLFRGCLNPAPE